MHEPVQEPTHGLDHYALVEDLHLEPEYRPLTLHPWAPDQRTRYEVVLHAEMPSTFDLL